MGLTEKKTVICHKLNIAVNIGDTDIDNNLDSKNEISDFKQVFDSIVFNLQVRGSELGEVASSDCFYGGEGFSGGNAANYVDNHDHEVCTENINNPVHDLISTLMPGNYNDDNVTTQV